MYVHLDGKTRGRGTKGDGFIEGNIVCFKFALEQYSISVLYFNRNHTNSDSSLRETVFPTEVHLLLAARL